MPKLCVDCVHYHPARTPLPVSGNVFAVAMCDAAHNHVVGDGIESGDHVEPCWEERSVGDPKGFAFHCGPDARYFEPKPVPVETKP